jgi:hypothetical protein
MMPIILGIKSEFKIVVERLFFKVLFKAKNKNKSFQKHSSIIKTNNAENLLFRFICKLVLFAHVICSNVLVIEVPQIINFGKVIMIVIGGSFSSISPVWSHVTTGDDDYVAVLTIRADDDYVAVY